MLTLHHLENSRSQRILWLLEELGVEYKLVIHNRDPKTKLAPKALLDVHSLGKSPVIEDNGKTIAESGPIVEYLIEQYGSETLPVPTGDDFERYRYWMHAAEGSVMPLFVIKLLFNSITRKPVPALIRPITKAIAKQVGQVYTDPSTRNILNLMEAELAKSTWFAGEAISGADFMMLFPAQAAAARFPDMADKYPNIRAFKERVEARPAYQKALEKGGKYELMG